jgi:hypothetical protein
MQRGWDSPLLKPWELNVFVVQASLLTINAKVDLPATIGIRILTSVGYRYLNLNHPRPFVDHLSRIF